MKSLLLVLVVTLYSPWLWGAEVQWLNYEQARAMQSDKPIFVFAKMRFCSACALMETNEFTDPELVETLNTDFLPVKETINFAFSRFVFEDLKDQNGDPLKFRGFPSVMLVQGDKYALSQGYKSAAQLRDLLNAVSAVQPVTPTGAGD